MESCFAPIVRGLDLVCHASDVCVSGPEGRLVLMGAGARSNVDAGGKSDWPPCLGTAQLGRVSRSYRRWTGPVVQGGQVGHKHSGVCHRCS